MATAMTMRTFRRTGTSPRSLAWAAGSLLGVCICVLLGLAIAFLPWWLVLAMVIAPIVIVGGAVWPFPILLLVLALIFQAVPGRFVPPLGSFLIHEIVLLYLVVAVSLRAAWRRENPLASLGPFIWPLAYLYSCVLVSVIYVKAFAPNSMLLAELRSFVTWLVLPLLAYVIRTEAQRKAFMVFTATVAVLVAIYVMAESFLHIELLASRVEILDNANTDVIRSLAGGTTYLMVLTLLWMVNRMSAWTRWFPAFLLVAMICAGGISVSFGRGVWIATAFGFVIATWLNRGVSGMILSLFVAGVVMALLLLGISTVKPRFVEAMADRALGVSDEIKSGGSFGWRGLENAFAFNAISKQPVTGVGIGGQYKKRISAVGTFASETTYIHNAYVGLMVKMGVQAILFPIMTVFVFVRVAFRIRKRFPPGHRALYAAVVATFFVPVITSFTQPEWLDRVGVAAFCVLIASLLLLERQTHSTARIS